MSATFSIIKQLAPQSAPRLGLILGSGLGAIAESIEHAVRIPYEKLPGFAACTVAGHSGQLCLGTLRGVEVACLQGRPHWYEGLPAEAFRTPIQTLKELGCDTLIVLSASGSLDPAVTPGQLMLVKDHINFQCNNPLIGIQDETAGARFVSMDAVYDAGLRANMLAVAKSVKIPLTEGVYVGTLGPSFETPAEIRAYRLLGADAVGMSTIPEVILARYYGLQVVLVLAITNMAAGLSKQSLDHGVTLEGAALTLDTMSRLILTFVEQIR